MSVFSGYMHEMVCFMMATEKFYVCPTFFVVLWCYVLFLDTRHESGELFRGP
jgi:hypothetical protein